MKMEDYTPAVLLSLKPLYWRKMLSGQKDLEIRKTWPRLLRDDPTVYVYLTAPISKIVGSFELTAVLKVETENYESLKETARRACLTPIKLKEYAGERGFVAAWHVMFPEVFSTPLELADLGKKSPPQSWQYIDRNRVEALLVRKGITRHKEEKEAVDDEPEL